MAKKAAKSWILYLLLATILAIGVCAAILIYLTAFRTPDDGEGIVAQELQNTSQLLAPSTTTTTTMITSTTSSSTTTTTTTSTTAEMVKSTEMSSTSKNPESTTFAEIAVPIDMEAILAEKAKNFEIVQQCEQIKPLDVSCSPKPASSIPSDPSDFDPIHYNLNLTIRDIRKSVIEGFVRIFATSRFNTNSISIHASKLHNLQNRDHVRLINCDTGETICISEIRINDDVAILSAAQEIPQSTNIRIDIDGFIAADTGAHIYKQVPTAKWRVPAMLGAVFEPNFARHTFPAFDNHNQKATVSMCVNHGPSMKAIANSGPPVHTQSGVSCFAKTLPITAQQIAFLAFEPTATSFFNRTESTGVELPDVEIISNLNNNFKPAQIQWIYNETSQVMSLLSRWSSFSYPLARLSVVIAPVMSGHSALGIITLPAQAVAYSKHTSTHETLIKEVIGQWMEGVVTTEHTCFEKALIAYLEWKINEELQIVKKTRKAEISKIRPRNLNETTSQLRVIRNLKSRTNNGVCSPRFVEVFYTLDETFGQETVIGMIRVIFDKFAFSTATVTDWMNAAREASGRPEAAHLISEWFERDVTRPVLRAVVSSQAVEFTQLTNETWTVPVEISGSSGTQLVVISQLKQSIPFVSTDYVVVDPSRKSHAFVVYDADTYLRLIRCFGDSRCPSKDIGGAFADLAAALIANILPAPENSDVAKWKSVFKFMAQQNLVEGTAACCVEHAIREMRKCSYWDIQDVCTKIQFNSVLAAVA